MVAQMKVVNGKGGYRCADGGTASVLYVDEHYAFGYHGFGAGKVCCIWSVKEPRP
jgi:hypothetical protein